MYISVVDAESGEELARYANRYFHDEGLATINKGSNLANMVLYKADLSAYAGRQVRLVVTDNATSGWGLVTVDSFRTYYRSAEQVPADAYTALDVLHIDENEYQVKNGGFETGDLTGWTLFGNIGGASSAGDWWGEHISYNRDGEFFFNGWDGEESATGTLTSSAFTVGGSGFMTFRLGGGKNTDLCRLEVVDAETGEVLARYGTTMFSDANFGSIVPGTSGNPANAADAGVYLANMVLYKADLSAFLGRRVVLRLVDEATSDWGLLFADAFVTYYETSEGVPADARLAENLL